MVWCSHDIKRASRSCFSVMELLDKPSGQLNLFLHATNISIRAQVVVFWRSCITGLKTFCGSCCMETLNSPCSRHHAWPSLCASPQMQHGSLRHPSRSQDDHRPSGAAVAPPPVGPAGTRPPRLPEPPVGFAGPDPTPESRSLPVTDRINAQRSFLYPTPLFLSLWSLLRHECHRPTAAYVC